MKKIAFLSLLLLLVGCARYQIEGTAFPLQPPLRVAVVPLANMTTTPYAGERAQAMVAARLKEAGFEVVVPPGEKRLPPPIGAPRGLSQEELAWARRSGASFLITGTVTEWRYKVGLEGMPAVALTLALYDLRSDPPEMVWSRSLAAIGHGRQSLGIVAQTLIQRGLR